jgi:hypothetical protein
MLRQLFNLSQASLQVVFALSSFSTPAIAYDNLYLICTDLAHESMQQSIAHGMPESQARDQYEKDLDRCRKEADDRSKRSMSIPRTDRDPRIPESDRRATKPAEGCFKVGKPPKELIFCPPVAPGSKLQIFTQAPEPQCPPGTESVTFSDGSKGCISAETTQAAIEPPPETPAPKTTVSGGGNA